MAIGAFNGFPRYQRGFAAPVPQLHHRAQVRSEAHPLFPVALERLDVGGMQAGGAGAGVDFCPKASDSQIRERHPLAQTDNGQMVKCLQKCSTGKNRSDRVRPNSRYSRRIMGKRRQISTARISIPQCAGECLHSNPQRGDSWHDRNGSTVHRYFRMRSSNGTKKRRGRQGPSR